MQELIENSNMVHSTMGLFHTAAAMLAIIFGSAVLLLKKATVLHKRLGYTYAAMMLLVNGSAFALYNLTGKPSIFHAFAIISLATLIAGIVPVIRKKKGWYQKHFYFMNWSVVGLYCAFWAETGTRLLEGEHFWWVVMLATMATAFTGMFVIKRKAKVLFG